MLKTRSFLIALAASAVLLSQPRPVLAQVQSQNLEQQATAAANQAILAMGAANKRLQYFDFGGFVFGGVELPGFSKIRPSNNLFVPARYVIEAPTGDPERPYWSVSVFRVGFNPGVRDLWKDAVPGASAYADLSYVRIYEVIKIRPVRNPLQAMKDVHRIYTPENFLKTAFRNATEELLDEMKPGEAMVVNRYVATGATLSAMLSPGFATGPKVSVGGQISRQTGVTYFKQSPNEVVASWRKRKTKAAQADLSVRVVLITLPLLADQVRSETGHEKTYAFRLDEPSQRKALMESIGVEEPAIDPALELAAEVRSSKLKGEYRLASLLGFFSRRSSRESLEIHYENQATGEARDVLAHARRHRGRSDRSVEAIEVGGRRYLRLDVAFEASAANAEDLSELHARASRLFPQPVRMPELSELPALSRKLRFEGHLVYSQRTLQAMLDSNRSEDEVCLAIEAELPRRVQWCEHVRKLSGGPAVFEYARRNVPDLEQAQIFRETVMGLRSFLAKYRKARAQASLESMTALLEPNAVLAPALRALERMAGENGIFREARLTAESVEIDALANARGGYAETVEELRDLVEKAVATRATFIDRLIDPFTFDYFNLGGIERPVR